MLMVVGKVILVVVTVMMVVVIITVMEMDQMVLAINNNFINGHLYFILSDDGFAEERCCKNCLLIISV